MNAKPRACDKCGAALQFPQGSHSARCEYCGTVTAIAPPKQVPEALLIADPIPPRVQAPPRAKAPPRSRPARAPAPPTPTAPPPAPPAASWLASWLFGSFVDQVFGGCISVIMGVLFVVGFGGFIGYHLWTDRLEDQARDIARTEKEITEALDRFEQEARRLQRRPFESEGNQRLRHTSDAWRSDLSYELDGDDGFAVRSAGPDRRRYTEDDIVHRRQVKLTP